MLDATTLLTFYLGAFVGFAITHIVWLWRDID